MTVKELQEILATYPDQAEVQVVVEGVKHTPEEVFPYKPTSRHYDMPVITLIISEFP